MTGTEIVIALILDDAAILNKVPVEQIKAGRLADDAPLDTLLVRTISVDDRKPLHVVGKVRRTDRVRVSVRAVSYQRQIDLIKAIRACLRGRTGNIGGGENVAITPAGVGPDLDGPGNSFEQSAEFRVSFDAIT